MIKEIGILIVISVVFFRCDNESPKHFTTEKIEPVEMKTEDKPNLEFNFNDYTWLDGKFRDTSYSTREQTHEIWHWHEDSIVMNGFFVKENNDTSTLDRNVIKYDKGYYKFINTVKGKSVEFRLQAHGQDSLYFSNPAHKYPQKITYKRIANDSIHLTLDGFVFQQRRKLDFKFKRYE